MIWKWLIKKENFIKWKWILKGNKMYAIKFLREIKDFRLRLKK